MRLLRRAGRGAGLGLLHAAVVLAVYTALRFQTGAGRAGFVQDSSTNLDNLRRFPFRVLLLSAVVVPDTAGLLVLVPLVVALTASARWLGRLPTLVAFAFGHVGATLVVAVVLVAGLTHGRLDPAVAHAPDVGVSYGLACVVGLLAARVPRRLRVPYVLLPSAVLAAVLAAAPDPTALGHLVALLTGFCLAVLVRRGARAQLP
ncbi:rhomboid-like protein [Kineococcus aurantiacus]|uniref:Rhomboid family intramembrane serine protease n=1 Tax=Kineococcus aurantiacus TaxID=37633 RepID=A0A7Y9DNU1_9ACTN|nr:rhomboid-like protein [Kineococcus aurantiacus]NYD23938.1 hypothetical protein [Kineococcus aurantiacus]